MNWKEVASSLKASYNRKRVVLMFSDTLSTALLRICETHKLSYEAAAERCGISPRYYGSLARRESSPSILVLEKICNGFCLMPNDLLVSPVLQQQLQFRFPMPVTRAQCFVCENTITTYPICPQCGISFELEYQSYCDRCGQCLSWKEFSNAILVLPRRK